MKWQSVFWYPGGGKALPTNVTGMTPSVQPAERTQETKGDKLSVKRDGGGSSGSAFSPRTDVNIKNSIDNITEIVLDYTLSKEDILDTEIIKLMNYNTKKEISSVVINNGTIEITSKDNIDGIFSKLLGIKGFEVISKYKGYLENNKKIIQKEI